jgi:hypothetical protein
MVDDHAVMGMAGLCFAFRPAVAITGDTGLAVGED